MDSGGRVIYIGSFSKVALPCFRLGYLVVPGDLVDAFRTARAVADRHSPVPDQAVMAAFISEGHFARHIRRMRTLYRERQEALLDAARDELDGILDVRPATSGMHLVGWLPEGVDDVEASRAAAREGVDTAALSRYALEPLRRAGLLLGYAAFHEDQLRDGVCRLAAALRGLGAHGVGRHMLAGA
jgi:GntR family transcriptional regulator/MocR family aminotransferase